MQDRVLLGVKRFTQHPNECAIAACSSVANFHDKNVDYEQVRRMLPIYVRRGGLHTAQQAKLFNRLGFSDVTIVTSNLDIIDYTWSKLSKQALIRKLNRLQSYYKRSLGKDSDLYKNVSNLLLWMRDKHCNNNIIIDHDFSKYIKRSIKYGRPVSASINATSMFKIKKWPFRKDSDIKGEQLEHAIVIRGYNKKYVYIVDSDEGYYKVSWEKFLTNMPAGDLILVKR